MHKVMLFFIIFVLVIGINSNAEDFLDKIWDISPAPLYVWFAYSNSISSINKPLEGVLRRYDRVEQNWRTFTIEDIFGTDFETNVMAVCTDGDSTVWVGTEPLPGHSQPYLCAYSLDNGENWNPLSTSDGLAGIAVKCIEIDPVTKTVWVAHGLNDGNGYSLSRSTNGGSTWTKHSPNSTYGVIEVKAYNNTVWAGADFNSGNKSLMKSTNNGDSWEYYDFSDTPGLCSNCDVTDVWMESPDKIHVSIYAEFSTGGNTGGYVFTTDGGATWTTKKIQVYNEYCSSVTTQNGIVWIGQRITPETIYKSTDSGNTWQGFDMMVNVSFYDPFIIRYDEYADIIWAGFNSTSFTDFQGGWAWTGDAGNSWNTDSPPKLILTDVDIEKWCFYE
jgi:hypothetical protein